MATIEEAREYAHSLKLKDQKGWQKYVKENILPEGMTTYPDKTYHDKGWKGWGDFLGIGRKAPPLPFEEAKKIVQSWELKDRNEFRSYAKKEGLPDGIPAGASRTYEGKEWKGWGDFLGTGRQLYRRFQCLPFEEAKKIVHSWGLKDRTEFRSYAKEEGLPAMRSLQLPGEILMLNYLQRRNWNVS
jgi:hypothetical protein